MTPVRLEPAAPRSRVKHSTTEPLRFLRKWMWITKHVIKESSMMVVDLSISSTRVILCSDMCGSRGGVGWQGVKTPIKITKKSRFTAPDTLKNHKATKPGLRCWASNSNGLSLAGRRLPADSGIWFFSPSPKKKKKKKKLLKLEI